MAETAINSRWVELIQHSTGANPERYDKSKHGFRNHFCAAVGSEDHATMKDMVEAGLMEEGRKLNEGRMQYFHATKEGCRAAGLSKLATLRAFI